CIFCYDSSGAHDRTEELKTEEVKRILDECEAMDVVEVQFGGGEPFLREDFLDLVAHAKRRNLRIFILTNGTLITEEKARSLAAVMDRRFDNIQVSLDGVRSEVHDRQRGVKGNFEKVMAGIRNLQQRGFSPVVNTVLTKLNYEHIPEMIALISALQKNGHTYQHEHSVYFKITTFPQYGDLANLDVTQLKTNAQGRLAVDEYQKEDVRDFALWKAWTPEDGPVAYDSPFGKGRPGWHIECSAMSMKYLGEVFDIHTGGVDLIFPHHTNEIAQSVGATKKPFVRYWVHNEHLLVEGKKMAKSAGNFYTLRDLLAKGYDPKAIRYLLLATHYRQKLNFSFAGLEAASGAVARLQELVDKLKAKQETQTALCGNKKEGSDKQRNETSNPETAQPLVIALAASLKERFCQAMDNDLMIADALAALFDTVKECNRNLEYYTAADARHLLAVLEELNTVLEVLDTTTESIPQEIQTLAELRQRARKAKDWKTADALREKIAAQGYHLADAPDGSYLLKKIK
ncbi:MAG: radical SAM protein, partial [Candidatus Woesearchaeota archaeon]